MAVIGGGLGGVAAALAAAEARRMEGAPDALGVARAGILPEGSDGGPATWRSACSAVSDALRASLSNV